MMARIPSTLLALAAYAGLGGCAYPGLGYGGVSVGYGTGGYYDGYYGAPYYGWYDGYYYPGAGYYVYDRGGHRHKWDDHHRRHWEARHDGRDGRENWAEFRRDGRDGDRTGPGRREGENRAGWTGRQDDGRGAEAPQRQDGGRRTYRDVRGPEAYAGNAPAAATTAQSDAAPVAAARSGTEGRAAWRNAQRERHAGSSDHHRADRSEGAGVRQSRGGGGGEGRHGGRRPRD